jgi:hypothetical protein
MRICLSNYNFGDPGINDSLCAWTGFTLRVAGL